LGVALVRRVPDAGKTWQWIWNKCRAFLMASATLELTLLTTYVLMGKRELDGVVMAFTYLDLMILIYLFRSRRLIDVFKDFPGPAPPAAVPSSGAFGPKRLGARSASPAVIFNTKVAVVPLGGNGLLEFYRDCVLGIHASLSSLGYDVVISPGFLHTKRMNLIVGFDNAQPTTREQLREKDIDYMVYEIGSVKNGGTGQQGQTLDIENDYLPSLAASRLVISPYRNVVRTLADKDIEARYVRWGYVPELNESSPLPDERRDFDCYFYGEITPARRDLLQTLVDAKLAAKASGYPGVPAFLRNHYLSRSKLVLSLQRGGTSGPVTPWRIMYALQNGYCVVTEQQENDHDRYNAYGCEANTAQFAQRCRELIESGDYNHQCDGQRERLMSEPMTDFFKGVI
ncbi:hypothetical protein ACFL1S_08995, partial [Pseudomonadota bacterium]